MFYSNFLHPFRSIHQIVYHYFQKIDNRIDTLEAKADLITTKLKIIQYEFRRTQLIQQTLCDKTSGISSTGYDSCRQVIVSLTTHGQRIYEVSQAIESIMQGTYKPNRIILWLSSSEFYENSIPEMLRMQQKRGLEICFTEDLGPHTKLLPTMSKYPEDIIITIDDDIYYAYDMVENLIKAYLKEPTKIHANRVAVMTLNEKHRLAPYFQWKHYTHPEKQTPNNFIIASEGCLYPPHCLNEEVFNKSVFRTLCPYADDVWFTAMALLNHTTISHLYTHYDHGCAGAIENYPLQASGLVHINEADGAYLNNKQANEVFEKYDLFQYLS